MKTSPIRRATRARTTWRAALSSRTLLYSWVVVALCLNVPLLVAALGRYAGGVKWGSLAGAYVGLVFIGYYVFILLVLLSCLFLATGAWPRLFLGASGLLVALGFCYFLVDGIVFGLVRVHIDAFWLRYLATTHDGIGITTANVVLAFALLIVMLVLEWWIFRLAAKVPHRRAWTVGLVATCVVSYVASQSIHAIAYEANDARITALTPDLPFYSPMTSHVIAARYADRVPMIRETDTRDANGDQLAFTYPLRDVSCGGGADRKRPNILILLLESWRADAMDAVVTPHLNAFARRSSLFLDHFSSGNSTPTGVFPIFYGIHSTYWAAVKANAAAIHNPALIDVADAKGYAFGIYAKSNFDRHKIKDAIFRDIEVHESFAGKTIDANDRDMTRQLLAFMHQADSAKRPFLGFAFYKSTHYPYNYPPDEAPFQPSGELNVILANGRKDPAPVLNDYRNSVHYVDALIGALLDDMRSTGLLDNTIVVITGDHGEEFNDNGSGYWGHAGNFTRYQARVPLIMYVPWRQPRRVQTVTAHVDIAPTLLKEGLGCRQDLRDYSNGADLFQALPKRRPVVVASYVNHALIVGDDVFAVWPMYVQRYRLDGSRKASGGSPAPDLVAQALEEMGRFYGSSRTARTNGRLGMVQREAGADNEVLGVPAAQP